MKNIHYVPASSFMCQIKQYVKKDLFEYTVFTVKCLLKAEQSCKLMRVVWGRALAQDGTNRHMHSNSEQRYTPSFCFTKMLPFK